MFAIWLHQDKTGSERAKKPENAAGILSVSQSDESKERKVRGGRGEIGSASSIGHNGREVGMSHEPGEKGRRAY